MSTPISVKVVETPINVIVDEKITNVNITEKPIVVKVTEQSAKITVIENPIRVSVATMASLHSTSIVNRGAPLTLTFTGELLRDEGYIQIGVIPAQSFVTMCSFIGVAAFDDTASSTIGDASAQGRIMSASEINMGLVGTFMTFPNVKYTEDTPLYIYGSGITDIGQGMIIVYYQ